MSKAAGGPSLAAESLDKLRPFHELRSYYLDGDRALGTKVRGKVNSTHTAAPEFPLDLIFIVERLPDKIRVIHFRAESVSHKPSALMNTRRPCAGFCRNHVVYRILWLKNK